MAAKSCFKVDAAKTVTETGLELGTTESNVPPVVGA